MTIASADRAVLKSIIKEMMQEDKSSFKEMLKEILVENQIIVSDEQAERRKRLESIIEDDFKKYDEVFRALA
jgi:uncharacterized membrane protein